MGYILALGIVHTGIAILGYIYLIYRSKKNKGFKKGVRHEVPIKRYATKKGQDHSVWVSKFQPVQSYRCDFYHFYAEIEGKEYEVDVVSSKGRKDAEEKARRRIGENIEVSLYNGKIYRRFPKRIRIARIIIIIFSSINLPCGLFWLFAYAAAIQGWL